MMKRILLAFMAMCVATSGFALEKDEFVYTPQGRFQIYGDNVASSDFSNLDGWTVVSATEGQMLDAVFSTAQEEGTGMWYAQSLVSTAGEGMYFKFEPSDATATYVVSFKMKGAFAETIRIKTASLSTDLVLVQGNTDGVYGGTNDVVTANTAEELTEDWQTFNYAIQGDGTARTYFISFTGMAATAQIADLQIAPAYQVADLRQRDAMIEKMEAYKNVYSWDQAILDDLGYDENLEALKAIGDGGNQAELDEQLTTCQEIIADFLKANMDDYLAGDTKNYLGIGKTKIQKASAFGDWTCVDRGFWSVGAYPDLGHYQQTSSWANGNPTNAMGVTMQKNLSAGSYVFAIEANAAFRENKKQSWDVDDGMKPAYGVAYIIKVPAEGVEPTAADTIMAVVKDLEPVNFTPFIVPVKVVEDGKYEFGFKAYCKEAYQALKLGSVTYVKDASFWGKNDNKYNQAQLAYEAAVRTQITTGRENLNAATTNIASEDYFWGKADLQACVDTIAPRIEAYEAMSQDDIIATFDKDVYEAGPTNENGLLEHEVYDKAVKYIIAANKAFNAVNDTLKSMQTVIDVAEATLKERIYDAATGKADLQAAIDAAKTVQTQMKAVQYSEENAAAIVAANKTLNEAITIFKSTIPASAITEIISVDFENGAKLNEETGKYETAGANTVMEFSSFSETTPTEAAQLPFELGFDSNGEKLLPGVLRVGNGTADATIPAMEYGTNILKVSMDWWFVRLTGKYVGFDLVDENSERVAGLYFSPYDGTFASGYDDFALDANDGNNNNNVINNFYIGNTTGDAGSCADNNLTHMEVILDYGEKSMYLVSTTPNGTIASNKVAFNCLVPVKFTVKCNYTNYNGRRCWFDNLKLEQITAGPTNPLTGIEVAKSQLPMANDYIYNLAGQKVGKDYKGIVIKNGKKMIQK